MCRRSAWLELCSRNAAWVASIKDRCTVLKYYVGNKDLLSDFALVEVIEKQVFL